ncbi:uncharacterized protein LOC111011049 isoform X2 [Momordica charantia]|uniref:Uncharacterized protein LOC111011049 isoform X2 n=1 Tax=Momordica charantia TaxID=3673 RepID=A0A6J1CFH7_MOMCH|nr:uncharacterized protein LOC111011049 isoform X2 [Momordica charantia]
MFDFLFGWRKASKCKKLIKQVQCRLKLLKNKKSVIAKQLREDVMELIKNGYEQTAFNRIVKDESRMVAYEILGNFCEFILQNLSYIRKHKLVFGFRDCPNDVNEAVSSLMFASARCGDLPELQLIRKLFGERYGRRFETSAVELSPGNLVNRQIKEKLSANSVSEDDKHRMINEIARDCFQPQLLALEYRSDWHQKQVEFPIKQAIHSDERKREKALLKREKALLLHGYSARSTSCDTLPQFPEERIVHVDDVVELCSSTTTEGDQILFKFKTAAAFPEEDYNGKHSSNQIHADPSDSWSEIENSSSKGSGKGSKRISLNKGMKKTEHNNEKGNNCHEISEQKQRKTENWVSEGATDKEMEWASFYKKPRRRRRRKPPPLRLPCSDLKSAAYDVFTYPGYGSNTETKKLKETRKSNAVDNGDDKNVSSYPVRNKKEALYLRAATFPPKQSPKACFTRTNSCPYKQPSHVHPKLPDYDDIAAKFMALKREHLQKNTPKP